MRTTGGTGYPTQLGRRTPKDREHHLSPREEPTWTAFPLVFLLAGVELAGTGLGEWPAPVAEECQPGTGQVPRPPETRQVAEGMRRDAASPAAAAAAAACSGRG